MKKHIGKIVIEDEEIPLESPTVGKITSPTGKISCSCGWEAQHSGTSDDCIPSLKGAFAAHQQREQSKGLLQN